MSSATSKPHRPLTPGQRSDLHCVWILCHSNGGSTRLSREPAALVNRGLVKRCEGAGLVRWHMTAEGTAQAEAEDRAREERRAVARANRGSNAMIG